MELNSMRDYLMFCNHAVSELKLLAGSIIALVAVKTSQAAVTMSQSDMIDEAFKLVGHLGTLFSTLGAAIMLCLAFRKLRQVFKGKKKVNSRFGPLMTKVLYCISGKMYQRAENKRKYGDLVKKK